MPHPPQPSRFATLTACLIFLSTTAHADDLPLHQRIDHHVARSCQQAKTPLADRCSDADFVRRVFLDLTGAIPNAAATRAFLADSADDKRATLIDELIESESFARQMAVAFDVMLMERRPDKYVTTNEWREFLIESFAANKPLNTLVSQILGADGVDEKLRPAARFYLDRAVDQDTLVRDIGRLFLGVDLQCAQCHDHPNINDYLHEHYYGLAVFVAGSKTFRQPDGTTVLQENAVREVEFASVFAPDTTRKTGPRLLQTLLDVPKIVAGEEYVEKPSRTVRAVPKFSLRDLLAKKLPSDETPEFARNMANRLWAMMMGRGIVHPLDMHHESNPPANPELLDDLAAHLTQSGFDVKAFLRELALSETYQRSSEIPPEAEPADLPPESFAVANMKGLSPEQLHASLILATGSQELAAKQIDDALREDDEAYQELLTDEAKLNTAREAKETERIKQFVSLFGSTPGRPEGEFQASLPHALFFANSETVVSWIQPESGNLTARLIEMDDARQIVKEAYLSVLSRWPAEDEIKFSVEHLAKQEEGDRRRAVVELVWSLVASAEFRLNH